ncbi:MAG TPA: WXG100 family type VII secretion target [Kineosporiaceae bacterium]|nr:WXG100 family type VII secretion target [Kineosporiaceae bacterium]
MAQDKLYNSGTLSEQQSQLKNREQALTAAGEDIRSELVRLEGFWEGNASQAFMQAANTWQQGYAEVMQGFNLLNSKVGVANEGFTSAETSRTSQSTGSWT